MDKRKLAGNADLSSSASVGSIRIGVLGGIGPEATGEFYSKLIKALQKRKLIKRNADYPQIIINSIPAPELVFDKITDEDLKPYINGLKFLDKSDVDFIVMVCNTIHLYHKMLQKKIKTSILDLRKEVRQALIKKGKAHVLVLGTPGTINKGLYEFSGIEYVRLTKEEADQISESILRFNCGTASRIPANICRKYIRRGVQVILACTELSLMLEKEGRKSKTFPVINTLDVMVDATVNKFTSLKYRRQRNN